MDILASCQIQRCYINNYQWTWNSDISIYRRPPLRSLHTRMIKLGTSIKAILDLTQPLPIHTPTSIIPIPATSSTQRPPLPAQTRTTASLRTPPEPQTIALTVLPGLTASVGESAEERSRTRMSRSRGPCPLCLERTPMTQRNTETSHTHRVLPTQPILILRLKASKEARAASATRSGGDASTAPSHRWTKSWGADDGPLRGIHNAE
ncbi:hypothetical protein F4775DRAFT_563084 [Biscogniauxia sp. FL1348]|nr:hypothetical protein F4775DRAFT_563084 [Biscogniauxia sp. FL1348]